MARFSERYGHKQPRALIQVDELDEPTRTAIWNLLNLYFEERGRTSMDSSQVNNYLRTLWVAHWELPLDEWSVGSALGRLRKSIFAGPFFEVMDIIEFTMAKGHRGGEIRSPLSDIFRRYLVGYSVIGDELIKVTDEAEVAAIEHALVGPFGKSREHLQNAVDLLAVRDEPKYASVAAQAIHAVEAAVRQLTGETVLSSGLKKLEAHGVNVHPALRAAWDKIYGYTSDAGGIRHSQFADDDIDEPMATYLLVSCSAFVNYLAKVTA